MASPPAYSSIPTTNQNPTTSTNQDPVPPYRASHAFANSAEELAALREFAASKLYVTPGTNGMLGGGISWSGPVTRNTRELEDERREWAEMRRRKKEERKKSVGVGVGGSVGGGEGKNGSGSGRKGSVGERLKRVFGSGLGGDGGKDVVR